MTPTHSPIYRYIPFIVIILLFILIVPAPPVQAQSPGWIPSDSNSAPGAPRVVLLDSTAQEVTLRIQLPGLRAETVQTPLGSFTRLSGEGFGQGAAPGQPDLPALLREVEIPWGAQVSLELVNARYREVDLAPLGFHGRVQPAQPLTPKCGVAPGPVGCDESIYSSDAYDPASPVRLGSQSELRGHRIQALEFYPALYQPVAGRLRVYSTIVVRLRFSQAGLQSVNPPQLKPASPVFEPVLAERLLNYAPASASLAEVPPQYLIISADLFAGRLAPFIALKESQGFAVTLMRLSETGYTSEQIQAAIQDIYDNLTPPDYLLLVGDNNFVPNSTPPPDRNPGFPTDLFYATMGGVTDYGPDMYYGRLPVRNTADLDAWVGKMLAFEQAGGSESWVKGASFLATNDASLIGNVPIPVWEFVENTHNDMIDAYTGPASYSGSFPNLNNYGGDQLYAHTYSATHENVVDALNAGRALAVYSGHGLATEWSMPQFTQADVRAMTGQPVSVAVGFACSTADFNFVESLADTWVTRENSGALTYIGSTIDTHWEADDFLERAFFENLFAPTIEPTSVGAALQAALSRYIEYKLGGVPSKQYQAAYQIYGDPSLQIIRQPKPPDFSIELSHPRPDVCSTGQAAVMAAVRGIYNFDHTVDMNITGLPAGLSAVFDPNPLLPEQMGALIFNSTIPSPGDFPLTVIGSSGSLIHEAPLVFSVHENTPVEVNLLTPAPFTPNASLRPTLTWSASQTANSYELQIASNPQFDNPEVNTTGILEPRYTLPFNLEPGATYWWRARAVNACGSSPFSLPERFTTLPLPGSCSAGGALSSIYTTDFEGDLTGWSDINQYSGPWELKSTYSHSPTHSVYGWSSLTYPAERMMSSPAIALPGLETSPIELTFWSRHVFESLLECKDGGLLDISTDGGAAWNPFPPEAVRVIPYDGLISSAHQNPLGSQFAWCGTRDWSKVIISLDDYAGQAVRLRWHLGTDDSTGEGDGWYVDDVSVESCVYPAAPSIQLSPAESQVTGHAGDTVSHAVTLTNNGLQASDFTFSVEGGSWQSQVKPSQVMLEPGASTAIEVSITIPTDVEPGAEDTAVLLAMGNPDLAVHTQANLTTRVSEYRLGLSTDQPLKNGFPGAGITFNVLVANTGMAASTIDLSFVDPPPGWIVGPLVSPIELAAGASQMILATVFVPPDAPIGALADFTFEASTQEDPGMKVQLGLQVRVGPEIKLYLPIVGR